MAEMLKFDLPKNQSSIIKVIGVGGGGSNAVTHMHDLKIKGVDFILCNTDAQALETSPVPTKIQLGTKGLGAGSIPSVGRESALEHVDEFKSLLEKHTKLLFITAGMGGGTGTGGAPVIAAVARELGILTVGIVTLPFSFEGRKRRQQAEQGIDELRKHVDTLLVISNDKLRELYGNLRLSEAFGKADDILATAARGIAEIITVPGHINVDFEDVNTVMKDSGVAIMGTGIAEGENRSLAAVENALSSPLLNDNNIKGASNILLYITSGKEEISMDEVSEITDYIQNEAGHNAEIIWGNGIDDSLGNKISITVIATGFSSNQKSKSSTTIIREEKKIIHKLEEDGPFEEASQMQELNDIISEITLLKKDSDGELTESPAQSQPSTESKNFATDLDNEDEEVMEVKREITDENRYILWDVTKEDKEEVEHLMKKKEQESLRLSHDNTGGEEKDELEERSQERIEKLKALSLKLRTPGGLTELEQEPAYVRRNVQLNDVVPSGSSVIARYTLSSDDENNTEIKSNNSFLHDNVD